MKAESRRADWLALEKRRANSVALNMAFLPDAAADADFEKMIDRLRGEPGSTKGGKQ